MGPLLWIMLGGGLGSGARYLVGLLSHRLLGTHFPFGTLTVNLVGSFLLGLILTLAASLPHSPNIRLFLTTGLMGGFTTYSTFNYETLQQLTQGQWTLGLLNLLSTVGGCLLAGLAGLSLARAFTG